MASKYKIFEFKNSQGFICYEFLREEMNGITMHGEISLARTKGKDNIKRLFPSDVADKVVCKSINPEFPPFEVSLADVYAVYRVLMCMALK